MDWLEESAAMLLPAWKPLKDSYRYQSVKIDCDARFNTAAPGTFWTFPLALEFNFEGQRLGLISSGLQVC